MKAMVVAATVIAVIPVLLSIGMPNWYLGDTQNAVDEAALDGETRQALLEEDRGLIL